jgi:DNA primase
VARIPESVIEKLKSQVDLANLIRAKGIELKEQGENLVGRCPFHDDHTPSLIVTPSKNLWHCMGACQTGGSVIDWVMKIEKVAFRHAVELLTTGDASLLVAEKPRVRAPKLPPPVDLSADDQVQMRQVIEFYNDTLKSRAPEAIKYLESRGINDTAAIEKFKIGFSNRTLGLRLPEARAKGGEIRERLAALGLYRESGHEHFCGSLVIPIMDESGNVTEVYGRKITPNLRDGTAYHTYLPGPHRGIFNPEGLVTGEVILCEALIDALSFWVNGYKNVTASYGVEGFTRDHLAAFKKYQVTRVYIAYDRDEAGDVAAEKLAKKLIAVGIESLRIKFPRGMDANDYILKMKPADKALKLLVQSADFLERRPLTEPTPSAVPEASPSLVAASVATPAQPLAKPAQPLQIFKAQPISETITPKRPPLPEAELYGEDVLLRIGDREYRVRGLKKNLSYEMMKINLRLSLGEKLYVDTLDLYQARQRVAFIAAAARDVSVAEEILKADLGRVLLKLEELQDIEIRSTLHGEKVKKEVQLTDLEKNEALELLQDPDLLGRILKDFENAGVVGEESNKLVGYLAATSRKLEDPLAVIIQSASSAGKSSLMEAILAMMPEEDKTKFSAMTGQSLFYMGETDLKHKILAIAEEQGLLASSYALKLLQSEGEISIASTGKNSATGKLVTHEYRVEGPVMIFLTTTSVEVDEELLNRSLVLTVNESREQTRMIHERQRRAQTIEGLLLRQRKKEILKRHQNAQRMLKPLLVANPYAEQLTFLDNRTRTRRDHMKYLTLIRTITLLHQHQRKIKYTEHLGQTLEYIEVLPQDIETANSLCHQVLGRSLDELPPQTRKLLTMLNTMVDEECASRAITKRDFRFTRKEVRSSTGWSDFQVQVHMQKLATLEYVLVHRGGRGQSFVYELLFDGTQSSAAATTSDPTLIGLIDASVLETASTIHLTQHFKHQNGSIEGSSSPVRAPIEGGSRSPETPTSIGVDGKNTSFAPETHAQDISENNIVIVKGAI